MFFDIANFQHISNNENKKKKEYMRILSKDKICKMTFETIL
jgi:ADP-glucose pyrophosphorylase